MAWVSKVNGKVDGQLQGNVPHEYLCPVHGRFTAMVPAANVPDEMPCPVRYEPREFALFGADAKRREEIRSLCYCGLTSPWSPSGIATKVPLASFNRGKADAPPSPHALTTRDLAEGMPMSEWRAKRAKLREDRRRKRVKEMRG